MPNDPVAYLMAVYMHEDLYEVHGSDDQAVQDFIRNDPHLVAETLARLRELLSKCTEQQLQKYADDLYVAYIPDEEDGFYRGWFTKIARQLEVATEKPADEGARSND